MFLIFMVYYTGVVAAFAVRIVQHPAGNLKVQDAFLLLVKSLGSWYAVYAHIKAMKQSEEL
jgi:hypothetical protein